VYGKDDRLLYIGKANDVYARFYTQQQAHSKVASWWPLARRLQVEVYSSDIDALDAEARAIEGESPEFNKAKPSMLLEAPPRVLARYGGDLSA
jgi:excinuclease UvrABC nuclease subunit